MKYSVFTVLVAGLFLFSACEQDDRPPEVTAPVEIPEVHVAFLDNLKDLCGETFTGEATYPDDPDHPLVATELRTHISQCEDDMVRIELIRDGDFWHGAWVLEMRDQGLHLFHDHLGDVRTMEDLGEGDFHGYGGYASDAGSGTIQYFPADEVTADIIPAAATNVWMMELDLENDTFIYYLERHDRPRFRAELNRE